MFSSTLFVFCRIYCLHFFVVFVFILLLLLWLKVCLSVVCVYMFVFCFVCCLHAYCCTVFLFIMVLNYLFSVYMFVFMLCLLILLVVVCDSVVACLYLMCLDLNVSLLWSRITWRNVNIQKKQYISALFKNIIKKL